jgi:type IV pilus assembly protein PilZ
VVEQRRFLPRATLDQPLVFKLKGSDALVGGVGKDISLGGMYIETQTPGAFNAEVIILTELPGERVQLSLPAVVRWTKPGGMGVQFGLLGAHATHLITEITRLHGPKSTR